MHDSKTLNFTTPTQQPLEEDPKFPHTKLLLILPKIQQCLLFLTGHSASTSLGPQTL